MEKSDIKEKKKKIEKVSKGLTNQICILKRVNVFPIISVLKCVFIKGRFQ